MPTLSHAARTAIAFGVDRMTGLRAIAATYLSRLAYEFARDGACAPYTEALTLRLCLRFRLGDYYSTVYRAYTEDKAAHIGAFANT